jgi:hypothetical protein
MTAIEQINAQNAQIAAEPQYRPNPALAQHMFSQGRHASAAQLAKPWQRITIKNTDPDQEQIFQDRYLNHTSFKPGESKEIDMPLDQIKHLIFLSSTSRGFHESGPKKGRPFEPHPCKITSLGTKQGAEPTTV